MGFRALAAVLLCAVPVVAAGGSAPQAPAGHKRPIDQVFHGKILKIKGNRVTIFYDFEDPDQLQDFETARPPRLLDASQNQVRIVAGRLVLEGSSAVRQKMEGTGEMRAHFFVRVGKKSNVGTVFTEPVLSDFYVVLNLFDYRFYKDGMLILAACGLHEDEGAQTDMSLVNWRDIFRRNIQDKVDVGKDIEVEVAKDGLKEYCKVGDVEGKGSSKGKTREMKSYMFGFWVHDSEASFDDLTLSVELTDEYIRLNDLSLEVSKAPAKVADGGPLAGIAGVPDSTRKKIESFAAGSGDVSAMLEALDSKALPMKAREVVAKLLCGRENPKMVPLLVDSLYSSDKDTRKMAIDVIKHYVGKTFGYSPAAGEKARSKSIQALNAYLVEHRSRFYG